MCSKIQLLIDLMKQGGLSESSAAGASQHRRYFANVDANDAAQILVETRALREGNYSQSELQDLVDADAGHVKPNKQMHRYMIRQPRIIVYETNRDAGMTPNRVVIEDLQEWLKTFPWEELVYSYHWNHLLLGKTENELAGCGSVEETRKAFKKAMQAQLFTADDLDFLSKIS